MNNRIIKFNITEIKYRNAAKIFDTIDRGYMPSILTGNGPQDISKESIIGLKPYIDITIKDPTNIWEDLRTLNNSTNFHSMPYPINRVGAIGYISYEALHTLEKIEKQTVDEYEFPLLNWIIYTEYYYVSQENCKAWHIELKYDKEPVITGKNHLDKGFKVHNLQPDFTPEEYKENVVKVQKAITNGDVYELNLTQGVKGSFEGSPYSLFKKLYSNNSAPYSAYLERKGYTVVSNSPELFLRCDKNLVETRPIKGTAPRGTKKNEDDRLKKELVKSKKNQAELYMIIDLMRNDLSKVCTYGSVQVVTPKRIETYKNVHHLVSIIQGELKKDIDYIDLFKATFPGGSITGCPKVRCMELTEKIEKSSRNLYTGTIFIMNREMLNSSIVIRSCVIKDDKIIFNSGGAITIDSDPKEEFEESKIKLQSIYKAVEDENNI
ncbi:MAG: hypothetical protein B6229_08590 [Spirochaetaceae bacterium 4572_7]|nr:MAG: hypothetical protein B6229_08590 [Spirochaetaceae bacterium 4572_7]